MGPPKKKFLIKFDRFHAHMNTNTSKEKPYFLPL